MLTVQLAAELRDSGIKVNSADPGYTATDLNGHRGRQTIPEGAAVAIRLALLPDDGPLEASSTRAARSPGRSLPGVGRLPINALIAIGSRILGQSQAVYFPLREISTSLICLCDVNEVPLPAIVVRQVFES
jgi:NAD(P)-dependent dehydrogenase (short-subunit alcohol dehydrogenase family)